MEARLNACLLLHNLKHWFESQSFKCVVEFQLMPKDMIVKDEMAFVPTNCKFIFIYVYYNVLIYIDIFKSRLSLTWVL